MAELGNSPNTSSPSSNTSPPARGPLPPTPPSPSPPIPSTPASASPPVESVPPSSKKSIVAKVLIILAVIILAAFIIGGALLFFKYRFDLISKIPVINRFRAVTLTWWGWDQPVESVQSVIEVYQKQHPNVKINYVQKTTPDLITHREVIRNRVGDQSVPDIVRIHSTWVNSMSSYLAPVPDDIYTSAEMSETFYPVVDDLLKVSDAYYAIPLSYDGLALYYNLDLFASAGIDSPPGDWEEFSSTASRLTRWEDNDPDKAIIQSGAALGLGENIAHSSDILGLMFAQSNIKFPEDITSSAAQDALTFYRNFATKNNIWSANFPESVVAFARGKVGMILAPYWRQADIESIAPDLNYAITSVPQAPKYSSDTPDVAWASFWVEAVSKNSAYKTEAFRFLKFLTTPEGQRLWYESTRNQNYPGELPSRRDMAHADWILDPAASDVLADAAVATSYPMTSCSGNDRLVFGVHDAIEKADNVGLYQALLNLQTLGEEVLASAQFNDESRTEICATVYGGGLLSTLPSVPSPTVTITPSPTAVGGPTVTPSLTVTPTVTTIPTGGLSSTPTPTIVPTLTPTFIPTVTSTPSITVTGSPASSPSAVPQTGFSLVTSVILVVGFILVGTGLFLQLIPY